MTLGPISLVYFGLTG